MRRLIRAAGEGDAEAQFNLGVVCANHLHDDGRTLVENRAEAIKWLLAAARQGLPRAQFRLAEIYADQPEGPEGEAEACFWFLLARGGLAGAHRDSAQSGYDRAARKLSAAQMVTVAKRAQLWEPVRSIPAVTQGSLGDERRRARL